MAKTKRDDYTSGYDQTDQDNAPAISFAAAFGEPDTPGVITILSPMDWLHKSPTALTIDAELTEQEWLELVRSIRKIEQRYQWYIGDAMVYGLRRAYGETEAQILKLEEITGKSKTTLYDYQRTALRFEFSERSESLDFEQHRVIAIEFPDDTPAHRAERLRWLHIAETQKLSGRKLSAEITKSLLPAEAGSDDNTARALEVAPSPAPVDEDDDVSDDEIGDFFAPEHRQRRADIEKKAKQNRWAEIDLNDILAEERRIKWLRKKVAAAKVEASRQARGRWK